ncbi:MAG TPA: PilZ domain-containing protein [Pyrinomonadaceae bacterium]|jgi:hypothetical protein|nr:PilZ domain-containing protein [Pyrinomonadaceae bacterium]
MAKARTPSSKASKASKAAKASKASKGTERRRAPRVKVNLQGRWEGDRGQQDASVTSLSKLGCFVLSGGTVNLKELIRLEMTIPDETSISVWAEVVDVAAEIGFALQFTSLEAADEERLGQFLLRLLAAEK